MTDINLDSNYNILFENGDLKVGDSEGQSIQLLLDTSKGEWTQNPLTGVGLVKWLNGRLNGVLEREIQLQLKVDGLNNLRVNIDNGNILIDRK